MELKVRETDSPFLLQKRGLGSQHAEGNRNEREIYLRTGLPCNKVPVCKNVITMLVAVFS